MDYAPSAIEMLDEIMEGLRAVGCDLQKFEVFVKGCRDSLRLHRAAVDQFNKIIP